MTAALMVAAGTPTASAAATEPPLTQALAQTDDCIVPANADPGVLKTVYQVGLTDKVSDKVMLSGFEAGWVESHMNDLDCGDSDSLGVFQQRPSQGWGTPAQILDVSYAANAYFQDAIVAANQNPDYTAGEVAQAVQRSAYPDRYDEAQSTAESLLAQAKQLVGTPTPPTMLGAKVTGLSQSGGRYDVFAVDTNHALVHKFYLNGTWSGWDNLGGDLGFGPTAVVQADGTINVFAVDNISHHLEQKWYANGAWSGWQDLGGALTSPPSAVVQADGTINVFSTNTSHQLVQKWYADGSWSAWQNLGGTLTSGPAAVIQHDGTINVFSTNTSDQLVQKWYADGSWSAWQNLGGTLTSTPSAVVDGNGAIHVFSTDTNDALVQKWYSGGAWSGYQVLGGILTSSAGATIGSDGSIHVFSTDTNHQLVQKWYAGGAWSAWQELGGTLEG
jgi:hypothetical protein